MSHTFIEHCKLLDPIWPTYIAYACLWFVISILYYIYTFVMKKQHALYLQRTLMLVPICKTLETLINGLFYNTCPWVSTIEPSVKYLDMARISIVTITYTVFLALLYIMSKGWNVVIFQLNRNQATYLTMIMGAVYLSYSAYFLASDFNGIR